MAEKKNIVKSKKLLYNVELALEISAIFFCCGNGELAKC